MKAQERKTPVTSEDEIKVGDLLEVHCRCPQCDGRPVRYMITRSVAAPSAEWTFHRSKWVFYVAPAPRCFVGARVALALPIKARAVVRIDTGLLDEENPYVAAKAPVDPRLERAHRLLDALKACQEKAKR